MTGHWASSILTSKKNTGTKSGSKKGIQSSASRSQSASRNNHSFEVGSKAKSPRQHKGKKHPTKKVHFQEQAKFVGRSLNNFMKFPKLHKPRDGLTQLLSKKAQRSYVRLCALESLPPKCLDLIA